MEMCFYHSVHIRQGTCKVTELEKKKTAIKIEKNLKFSVEFLIHLGRVHSSSQSEYILKVNCKSNN